MTQVVEWAERLGTFWKAAIAIVGLAGVISALVYAVKHAPEANDRLDQLESATAAMQAHDAHDDTVSLFALCRESETALPGVPEVVAVNRCLQRFPSLLDVVEVAGVLRQIQRAAESENGGVP